MNPPATHERLRFNMIEQQIRPWDVHDPEVLELLNLVRREDYVPPAHRGLAFFDMELPLADEGSAGRSMLSPKVEARILNDLQIRPNEKILEIGAGSGYMAALLAARGRHVLTLEIDSELAAMARGNLAANGVSNAEVLQADGAAPLAAAARFDVIVLSGSVAQVPQHLLSALNIGGRLAAIVGEEPMMRAHFVTRTGEGQWETRQPWDTSAPRLLNFPEPSKFRF
ncbi:MAG: protein-L-isoaspartate O-methyltransferase [Comamonadaceae bacterium]|nr:MAG: protein-L-isoaspartate O-methyltransferase [Comamonadaceae bacterium]